MTAQKRRMEKGSGRGYDGHEDHEEGMGDSGESRSDEMMYTDSQKDSTVVRVQFWKSSSRKAGEVRRQFRAQ